ncbi:MAG: TRL domain-containing protein [Leptospira sp.]|nr:TRL domain-containing protein [Leptospira sp.]
MYRFMPFTIYFISLLLCFSCVSTASFTIIGSARAHATLEPIVSGKSLPPYYKHAESCNYNLFGIFAFGNASIFEVITKGNITQIGQVDRLYLKYSDLIGVVCTKISGN